ncbi:hypothetical protein GQ54DRAFT_190125 [Martensiomyces pterosporus]|nr:hypothetical protein GQ54DRAFT_190125 [Martensiomyces pterosporus]
MESSGSGPHSLCSSSPPPVRRRRKKEGRLAAFSVLFPLPLLLAISFLGFFVLAALLSFSFSCLCFTALFLLNIPPLITARAL